MNRSQSMNGKALQITNILSRLGLAISVAALVIVTSLPAQRVHAAAAATVVAGLPGDGPLVDDIPATSAQFWNPADVVTGTDSTIYIADKNHNEVRKIGADGIIHAAFGDGVAGCGTGNTQTQLYSPQSLARDQNDNLFVATGCGEIVRFTPGNATGTVVAGKFDGSGNANPLTHDGMNALDVTIQPSALSYDQTSGGLYFYDSATQHVLLLTNGSISIVAGTGTPGFSGDNGPATAAQFSSISDILFANGNLYISDWGNCRVRVVTPDSNVNTVVGNGNCNDANLTGPGLSASVEYPGPLAFDSSGMLYIAGSLSGSIIAYDTDTQNTVPVINIPSNTTGLALESTGTLLALHSGIDQQLFRVTGLPSPTPPPDGKQHGKVTGVSWTVTPQTPLWNIDVTVNTTNVNCAAGAKLVISAGSWTKRPVLCATGGTAPASFHFNWKVFNTNNSLTPDQSVSIGAFVAKSDATKYGGPSTQLLVPSKPTLIGVGDSYLSGHHQVSDEWLCADPQGSTPCKPKDYTPNDPAFSWVTRLAADLNTNIPTAWQFAYDSNHLLAKSGATTQQIVDGQSYDMIQLLQGHGGSWNVVALSGGANDADFGSALEAFYMAHNKTLVLPLAPWGVKKWSDCPNTEQIYNQTLAQQRNITANLREVMQRARDSSNGSVRFLDMLYPYTLKSDNICNIDTPLVDVTDPSKSLTWHGAKSVIDTLDTIHTSLDSDYSDVLVLDLRQEFGTNPLLKIQQTRNYGYPHANDAGQDKTAKVAAQALKH